MPSDWTGVAWSTNATNRRITELYVNTNGLTGTLNVSALTALEELDCENNKLSSLNVSGCTALDFLYCNDNNLTSLNVSGLTALEELICANNYLTSLNLSGLANLNYVDCRKNYFASTSAITGTGSITAFAGWDDGANDFYFAPQNKPSTYYSVNIGTFKGGSVTAGSKSAAAGETVTLTVSPYTGYELDAITVHRTGSTTTVTLSGTGSTRTFTMPDSDVIIDATFKAATAAQILWEQALAVIVAATYDVPQSAAATEADLAAWLADYINGLLQTANINLSLKAADIWIISGSFAPVTSGTNGTFTFFPLPPNVSVSTLIDGTIVAGAVGNAKTDNYPSLQAYVQNGVLHVNGLAIGAEWRLYNVMGTLIYSSVANAPETTMPLPQRGVYIVTDGKTTVKVVN